MWTWKEAAKKSPESMNRAMKRTIRKERKKNKSMRKERERRKKNECGNSDWCSNGGVKIFKIAHGLFSACATMIPMKTMKHMNVLYLSIKSCSRKKDISHFLFRNRNRIVETLLLKYERSYSASSQSLSRRRLENKLLKLKKLNNTPPSDSMKLKITLR